MLATPCADKRVDTLSTMSEVRGFTINEIIKFVEHWITTQSKFPVLADIYVFLGKATKQKATCEHRLTMPISSNWNVSEEYRNEGMAKLKAYDVMIEDFQNQKERPLLNFCCHFSESLALFYDLTDSFRKNYNNTTIEQVSAAYNQTLKKLKSMQYASNPKNERGVYSDD
jgi:hypothetical protein